MPNATITLEPTTLDDLIKAVNRLSLQLAAVASVSGKALPGPLNTFDAAKYLGMSPHTLRKLEAAGLIQCERVGRDMKFRQRDLDAYREKIRNRRR
jgi:excisionase family DNA binding protein